MAALKTRLFFDKTFILTEENDVAEFAKDPETFLDRIGFFQGLDGFNGLIGLDGKELENVSEMLSSFRSGKIVILGHLGIPYKDYCKCVCEVR